MRFAKQSKGKKNIAVLLVVAMLLTIMPVAAFAVDEEGGGEPATEATAAMYDGEGNVTDKVTAKLGEQFQLTAKLTTSSQLTTVYVTWTPTGEGNTTITETYGDMGYTYTSSNTFTMAEDLAEVTAIFTDGENAIATAKADIEAAGNVAKIGDTEYETLDAAIEAANDGDTIEVLKDCESEGIVLNKNLTIKGNANNRPTLTFDEYGITANACSLIFKDCILDMTISDHKNHNGATANLIDDSNLTLDNVKLTLVNDESDTGGESGIYLYQGSNLYIRNGSAVVISGFNDSNGSSGIFADNSEYENMPNREIIIDNGTSVFISDCGWHAMTINPINVTVSNKSVLTLTESGNDEYGGGLGCYYGELKVENNSKVIADDNPGARWGIFIKDLFVDGTSSVSACSNQGDGLTIGGKAQIKTSAEVNLKDNSGSGLWIYPETEDDEEAGKIVWAGDCNIENGANVTITGNKGSGIYNNNILNMQSGVIMYNSAKSGGGIFNTNKLNVQSSIVMNNTANYGGGIYNTGAAEAILTSDVQIYNNHAKVAGDDIFNNSTAHITFGVTGDDWKLDGAPDCDGDIHVIDSWYEDGWAKDENGNKYRWEAHATADNGKTNHVVQFTDFDETGRTTLVGTKALKAAHGLLSASQLTCNYYVKGKNGNVTLEGAVEYNSEIGKVGTTVTKNQSEYTTYNGKTYVYDETNPSNKNSVVLEKSLEELNNVPYPLTLNYIREEKDDTPTGGGGTITPNPDPEPPTTDPEKPPVEIPDPDVPLVEPEDPTTEIDEPDVPLIDVPGTPVEEIDEPEVPLGDAPKTGDAAPIVGLIGLLIVAVAGLVVVRRKFN